jgi:hypothetical protein
MTLPRIISVSRRTDIPAFYADWFIRRIRAGGCTYPHPFRRGTVCTVDLRPEAVAGIVFWTRHARPLLRHLDELDQRGFAYYVLYTLTGYPRRLERRSPARREAVRTIRELSDRVGRERVTWRYDPVLLDAELTPEWHARQFSGLARELAGHVDGVIVSVADPYRKTLAALRASGAAADTTFDVAGYTDTLVALAGIAAESGLPMQSCAEAAFVPGIEPGGCVDAARLARVGGRRASCALHRLREGCLCTVSTDIGANDTCAFGCRYCYATAHHDKAREAVRAHRPEWTSIVG